MTVADTAVATRRTLIDALRAWFYCRRGFHWPEIQWIACAPVGFRDECRFNGASLFMVCQWCGKRRGPIGAGGRTIAAGDWSCAAP